MSPQAHQFVTALSYGDAIGDYTLEIQRILRQNGYESDIYSEIVHPRMARYVKPLFDYEWIDRPDGLMIIHFSIGSELGYYVPYCKARKLLVYHNITPYEWFVDMNTTLAFQCLVGRNQLKKLRDYCPVALGDSEYNRQELEDLGFEKTGVLPIRLDFEKFDGPVDKLTNTSYDDNRTTFIVVGRVIPNKKLEDCLKAFSYYQKHIQPLSRFIFVGMWGGFETYYFALRDLVTRLGLQEVIFTGHIQFDELLAYYHLADVLLIMSEHEGFCVPLLEAFYMKVPVIAWDACAIRYTAGKGAVLLSNTKDYTVIGELMNRVSTDNIIRKKIVDAQIEQLRIQAQFPFEDTLLNAMEELRHTEPRYIPDEGTNDRI